MKSRINTCTLALAGYLVAVLLTHLATAQTWTSAGPVPRIYHSAVLDASSNRMVVFGGLPSNTSGQQNLNDVWRLNASSLAWTAVHPKGTPPAPRVGHTAVYDPGSNRMVVFGGGLGRSSPCENDVWIMTNANGTGGAAEWIQLNPNGGAPAPRMQHGSVYDPNTNTMIVYGGQNCFSTIFGDVWVLSHANGLGGTPTWTELAPTGTGPGTREIAQSIAYDAANNILIIFGAGSNGGGVGGSNDVWVLSHANGTGGTPTWTQLSPKGTRPTARQSNSATYDSTTNSLTIFGGSDLKSNLLGDGWVLSDANGLGGTPAWTQLNPSLYFPEARNTHTGVYNPSTNKLTVFGGIIVDTPTITLFTNDAWVLDHANGH